jgi:thiamine biosynthesis lipoprotein
MTRFDERFPSMGGEARVRLESDHLPLAELERHAATIQALLDDAESTLSRFRDDSELSALNRDPRPAVPASPLMRQLARAVRWAGARSGGLVDATLLTELEDQGYAASRKGAAPAPLHQALAAAPARRSATSSESRGWTRIAVDRARIIRPPGLKLDSGGLGKGLAADLAAATLPAGVRFSISCCGDLAIGGPHGKPWEIAVAGVDDGSEVHRLWLQAGGVATSGIHNRLWQRPDGSFAHHVLDPATGEPAWTGLVAATAVAQDAVEAEVLAKIALLSGPGPARRLLRPLGGVLQHDDGTLEVIPAAPVVRLRMPRALVAA